MQFVWISPILSSQKIEDIYSVSCTVWLKNSNILDGFFWLQRYNYKGLVSAQYATKSVYEAIKECLYSNRFRLHNKSSIYYIPCLFLPDLRRNVCRWGMWWRTEEQKLWLVCLEWSQNRYLFQNEKKQTNIFIIMYMSCKDPFVTKTAQTHSIKAEPLLEDDWCRYQSPHQ